MAFPASQSLIHDDHRHHHPPEVKPPQSPTSPPQEQPRKYPKPPIPEDIDNQHYSGPPIKFLPLHHIYSTTSSCSTAATSSSNAVSKKVRAWKLTPPEDNHLDSPSLPKIARVYSCRSPEKSNAPLNSEFIDESEGRKGEIPVGNEVLDVEEEGFVVGFGDNRSSQMSNLGLDSRVPCRDNGPKLRESRFKYKVDSAGNSVAKKRKLNSSVVHKNHDSKSKKWFQLAFDGVDPKAYIGLKCKVYWPLDNAWYRAVISCYDADSVRHNIKYDDGDEEELILSNEQIKFHISREEMQKLNLKGYKLTDDDDPDHSLLIGLAATVDDCRELEAGDIIWAKLTGHAMWPAVVMDESLVIDYKGLNKSSGGRSVPVQFFGTHDFARIQVKQIVSFVKGLISCFHLKCKSVRFIKSLKEAKVYLNEQRLPTSMLSMQRVCVDVQTSDLDDASMRDDDLSNSNLLSNFSTPKFLSERHQNTPGYRPVRIVWKDSDRCNVCHMDEEYVNNLFLQCDKCRIMVHARCYGEESVDGTLWLCKLCRDGAPEFTPPCRLCPVVGGAMKPTTDGHWAHLACAIWIPETCLSDIKKMEPIDGLRRIKKDRRKLLCSICGVAYGACIQCSNPSCYVAYHPLCARAAGFCVELRNEGGLHLISIDEDEEEQCVHLLSFCQKHKQPSNERPITDERTGLNACPDSSFCPASNESGCARCEPYDYSGRRGRKEPEVLVAASLKRSYLEDRPYLVGGFCQQESLIAIRGSKFSLDITSTTASQDSPQSILSVTDKYRYMRGTFRKRLVFGKSRIHGFGIFAKQPHKAGDMVIEYTGELVRPSVADRRERFIYNSFVGAGTYMFRIDDERVIDATRAGSIAHLINHSCEPNCYSRVITICGDEHIIIFAKRDITQWEELTYDYRFVSIDERLACYCGFERCRGVVNDTEAEEQAARLHVNRRDLTDFREE